MIVLSSGATGLRLQAQSVEATFQRAAAAFHRGLFHQAEVDFARVASLRPDSPKGFFGLAMCQARTGRAPQALASFEKAVAKKGADGQVYLHYGISLEGASRPREALAALEKAAELEAKNHEVWLHLGLTRLRLGEHDAARADFERSRKLAPRDPRPAEEIAGLDLRAKKLDEAEKVLASILKQDPRRVRSLYLMSRVMARRKNRAAARDLAKRWREAEESERVANLARLRASSQVGLGYAALQRSDPAAAVGYFEAALETDASQIEARHALTALGKRLSSASNPADRKLRARIAAILEKKRPRR